MKRFRHLSFDLLELKSSVSTMLTIHKMGMECKLLIETLGNSRMTHKIMTMKCIMIMIVIVITMAIHRLKTIWTNQKRILMNQQLMENKNR